jgi:hypothetical protein
MSGSPQWKLYDPQGEYQAASKQIELLAACIGVLGEGATIRQGHSFIVWREGTDGIGFESYDQVAITAYQRVNDREVAAQEAREVWYERQRKHEAARIAGLRRGLTTEPDGFQEYENEHYDTSKDLP